MLGWMDHMLRSKIVRKEVLKIVDFTDANSVLSFASDSCTSASPYHTFCARSHTADTPCKSRKPKVQKAARTLDPSVSMYGNLEHPSWKRDAASGSFLYTRLYLYIDVHIGVYGLLREDRARVRRRLDTPTLRCICWSEVSFSPAELNSTPLCLFFLLGKGTYAELHGVNTPAPSFNAMASTGCRSVNQEIRTRYFDLYTSNSAFARVQRDTRNAKQRLQQRVTILRTDGEAPQHGASLGQAGDVGARPRGVALSAGSACSCSPSGYASAVSRACLKHLESNVLFSPSRNSSPTSSGV